MTRTPARPTQTGRRRDGPAGVRARALPGRRRHPRPRGPHRPQHRVVAGAQQRRLEPPGAGATGRDAGGTSRGGCAAVISSCSTRPAPPTRRRCAEIVARCQAAGAKLLLVGDPRQLGAIGPGGALSDVAEHGIVHQLAEVRRFANDWEGPASLRLRDGDVTVLDEYAKHGRLVDGGTAEQAEAAAARAWLADSLAGKESLLMVGTNAAAARVSAQLRAELVALGRVEEHGVELGMPDWEGVTAGVGRPGPGPRARPGTCAGSRATPPPRSPARPTASPALRARRRADRRPDRRAPRHRRRGRGGVERVGRAARHADAAARLLRRASTCRSATPSPATAPRAAPSTPPTPSSARARPPPACYVPGTRGRESNTFYVVTQHARPTTRRPARP